MSKFFDVNIKNNSENININQQNNGGYNIQENKIIHKTVNHHHNYSQNKNENSKYPPSVMLCIIIILFNIWPFFCNYEKIYPILRICAISPPLFAFISLVILLKRNEIEKNDIIRFFLSSMFAIIIFFLTDFLNSKIPEKIIILLTESKSLFDFWGRLSEYGKNIFISITVSCFLIIISIILNNLLAIRTIFYALANNDRTGFCYLIFNFMRFFKFRICGIIIILLNVLMIFILEGYIFHID